MVKITNGRYAVEFLTRLISEGRQRDFCRITMCSPYIDDAALLLLDTVSRRMPKCEFTLITRPEAAEARIGIGRTRVVWDAHLHAKVLLAMSRDPRQTRTLVTSANLTNAGASLWKECGVVAAPTSEQGALVIHEVDGFLGCLIRKQLFRTGH